MTHPDTSTNIPELREHEFDGIREFDNHLPQWWLWSFYLACAFAFFYWLWFHGFALGDSPREAFDKEMAAAQGFAIESMFTDDELRTASNEPAVVAAGKDVFMANCVACHSATGGGTMNGIPLPGPNLTDNAWIHGGAPTDIVKTIWKGVPEKGMVTWGPVLGKDRVRSVGAYLLTVRNTNVPGGKPPEGVIYDGL